MKRHQHFLLGNRGAHLYNGNIQCKHCKKQYKTEKTLLKHKCSYCANCNVVYSSFRRFQSHKCKSDANTCKDCLKTFKDKKHMDQHACSFCSKCATIFASHQKLKRHKCKSAHLLVPSSQSIGQHHTSSKPVNVVEPQPSTSNRMVSILASVGSIGVYIGDEAMVEALQILRDHLQNPYIGYMTPVAIHYAIDNPTEPHPPPCPVDQLSINFHHLRSINHWITSVYEPATRRVYLYDSLRLPTTLNEVMPQLQLLYGIFDIGCVDYVPVSQQSTDPACGAYAVAFAFSYALNIPPESQQFMEPYMRQHLRKCLTKSEVLLFPAFNRNSKSDYFRQYKQKRRQDPSFQAQEIDKKRRKRSNPIFHQDELDRKRAERSNPIFHQDELDRKRAERSNPIFHQDELDRKRADRSNPIFHQDELDRKRAERSNPIFHKEELHRKRADRSNPIFHQDELDRKRTKRSNPTYHAVEVIRDRLNKQKRKDDCGAKSVEDLIKAFHLSLQHGCIYVCCSCQQLWFRESVVSTANYPDVRGEWLCHTCASALKKKKIPALSTKNNMRFPRKPPQLHLNQLEERLVSPINVFMQLRELPRGGQYIIKGNVVNVPSDNFATVKSLPRRTNESNTIPLKLKRRLRYRSHYMYENIRPAKCVEAAKYLLQKPLFKKHLPEGFNNDWLQQSCIDTSGDDVHTNEEVPENTNQDNAQHEESIHPAVDDSHQANKEKEEEVWSEDDEISQNNLPLGTTDTMLIENDYTDDGQHIFCCAPSEGNQPVSSFQENIEELAFPTIYCGETRPTNKDRAVQVHYSDICKFEARNEDRRVALNIPNLFFKTKKLQVKQIRDKTWLSVRRLKTKDNTFTAGDFKDPETVNRMVKLDEGFRIFRTIRGSPPYWEAAKKDAFAMVRQLGVPTFFISLSASESRWKDLLKSLRKILDGKDSTEEEMNNLSYHDKCRLVQSDPITVSRFFDYRIQKFINLFLKSPLEPIGKLKDFFYRVEFQQRGSPHIHAILWIENAPLYGVEPTEDIENFISRYLTCSIDSAPDDLIKVQTHRHTHTCKITAKRACRFHFPIPPMRKTMVLEPVGQEEKLEQQDNVTKINKFLEENTKGVDMTFDEFLSNINMTEKDYITAIRSTIKDTKVFLKRDPKELRINSYNANMLKAWNANLDIQYITSAYSVIMYIVSYMSKGQRGMSELLRRATEEVKEGNYDIQDQVRQIGNKFLKHVEISAQEASYLLLQMPLRRASVGFIFVNTSPPEERPFLLKSLDLLEQLPKDSTDIQCGNVIRRYTERPSRLNDLCLADFATQYDLVTIYRKAKPKEKHLDLPEVDYDENHQDDPYESDDYDDTATNVLKLKNGDKIRKRKKRKILRYVHYNKDRDANNYYREQLMLFYPWKTENTIIGTCESYEDRYLEVEDDIKEKRDEYEQNAEEIARAERDMENLDSDDENIYSDVAPCTQHANDTDRGLTEVIDGNNNETLYTNYDIAGDLGIRQTQADVNAVAGTDASDELLVNRMSDENYRKLVQSFNRKQREIFYHILKSVKTSSGQFFIFLSGGAGVGKTKVTLGINQALQRWFSSGQGENPESKHILLAAPTGKAAYLIRGNTVHSAFKIPVNQSLTYKSLTSDKLNSLRKDLGQLRVLIIDEISMLGCKMLNFINLRLQDVMQLNKPFGGVSVLAVGDLFQLQPVMDGWVFQHNDKDYGLLAPNIWIDNFRIFELTDIMRQKDDQAFAKLLNRMREGKQTENDVEILQNRIINLTDQNYPYYSTHILYHNQDVNDYNTRMFELANTTKITSTASDTVIGDVPDNIKLDILARAPTKAGDAMGLAKVFKTAVSLRNELTINLDVEDGLVNGASCTTKSIQKGIIWVQFDDDHCGKKLRQASKNLYRRNIRQNWVPIKPVTREFTVGRYKNAKVSRLQYPLQMAAAKTVHRSQGDTMESAVIQLPSQKRAHLHYVAFSRVTKLENIHIIGKLDPSKITISKAVVAEMERLRKFSQLALNSTPLYSIHQPKMIVYFHNCQSLRLHYQDLKADDSVLAADLCCLVETKLGYTDEDATYTIPNFEIIRSDFQHNRSAYGSCIYVKHNLKAEVLKRNNHNIEITVVRVTQPTHVNLASVYCRPKEDVYNIIAALETLLEQQQLHVIIGDFNADMQSSSQKYREILHLMNAKGYTQVIKDVTTNGNTKIDLIFTNIPSDQMMSGTLESYYSYHKPLWFAMNY